MSADPVILKILSGVQGGVEVALADGTYLLGSSAADDIQLIDVSLLPGHARLRIAGGKIEIASQAGTLQLGSGSTADGGWRALDPLEVVTAGTTRFALGPRSANWASVADDRQRGPVAEIAGAPPPAAAPGLARGRLLAMPALLLVVVALFGAWYALTGGRLPSTAASHAEDLRLVRGTLDGFPFGRPVATRQEVDGAIYATGYVATPVERRALAGAIDKTGVPAHVRLFVLDDMRREIADLIAAEKLAVTFSLSETGEVTLDGVVLQAPRERKLVEQLKDSVPGVSDVRSNIRTGTSLLDGVRQLVATSQLKPWLLLRLDGDVIEVSGALPTDKVDAWVGFLQSYATRFAGDIALRSFVQLQTPSGRAIPAPSSAPALTLGAQGSSRGDTAVDLEKLRRGDFSAGDIFVGPQGAVGGARGGGGAPASPLLRSGAPGDASARQPQTASSAGSIPRPGAAGAGGPDGTRAGPGGSVTTGPASDAGRRDAVARDPGIAAAAATRLASLAPTSGVGAPSGNPRTPGSSSDDSAAPATARDAPRATASSDPGRNAAGQGSETADGQARDRAAAAANGSSGPSALAGAAAADGADPAGGMPGPVADARPATGAVSPDPDGGTAAGDAAALAAGRGPADNRAVGGLADRATRALQRFRDGRGSPDATDQAIDRALALLESRQNGARSTTSGGRPVADWYLPLYQDGTTPAPGQAPCWAGTALTADDLLPVLFWLDVMSASRLVTLAAFDPDQQALLLEAALDPKEVQACSRRSPAAATAADHSLYLREVSRNPGFVGFVLRDLPTADLDVAGASLGRRRYIITREGARMAEGAAPDRATRIAIVGELGLALQREGGLSVQVFGPDISWIVTE